MSKITLITDLGLLNKEIVLIGTAAKKLDARIHVAACSAVAMVIKSGDIGPINRLYLAMGKGTRKSALTSWFLTYGKVSANTDKDSNKIKPFLFDKEKVADLDGGMADPWYDHKVDPTPDEVFDAGKALGMLLKKLNGALAAGRPIKGLSEDQIKILTGITVADDVKDSGLMEKA